MLLKTFFSIFFSALLVIILSHSCQKRENLQIVAESESTVDLDKSQEILKRVKDFQNKMVMHRDNPYLKSETKYEPEEAVSELEDLVNFEFGYGALEVKEQEIVYTEIEMPLDELLEIADGSLSVFYFNDVIQEIQSHFPDLEFDNPKLMFADLKYLGNSTNGDAIIGVSSYIGDEGSLQFLGSEVGYRYGKNQGDCDQTESGYDAADLLYNELNTILFELPPPGYVWRYSNPQTTIFNNPANFPPNPDPADIPDDNYQDYKIFYATALNNDPVIINGKEYYYLNDDDKCVSSTLEIGYNLEMEFYLTHYDNIGEDDMIDHGNNVRSYDVIDHDAYVDVDNGIYYEWIWHELKIMSSYRYAVPDDQADWDVIQDYEN